MYKLKLKVISPRLNNVNLIQCTGSSDKFRCKQESVFFENDLPFKGNFSPIELQLLLSDKQQHRIRLVVSQLSVIFRNPLRTRRFS